MKLKIYFFSVFLTLCQVSFGFQVVINELMPDPNPAVNLPEEEYVEIYNTSDQSVSLSGWTIQDNSSQADFPDESLAPQEYAIVVRNSNVALFESFGRVIGLSSLPSLNNSGDTFTLRDAMGEISDQVAYTSSWYNDPLRDDGGYSLERINPENDCDAADNWMASLAAPGGTPGAQNSIYDPNFIDTSPISVLSAAITSSDVLTVRFSKKPDETSATNTSNYFLSDGLGNPENVGLSSNENSVFLEFADEFEEDTIYELTISNIQGCPLLSQIDTVINFGIPDVPERGDVVINEILFNPVSGGVDYLELYNTTNKLFALDDLTILEIDPETNELVDFLRVQNTLQLMLPNTYWVFTEDAEVVQEQYTVPNPGTLLEANLPNYPDDLGTVAILNGTLDTIDVVTYSEDWHYDLISDQDGVSLERLDPAGNSQNPQNWFSASFTVGNGTPTGENSQSRATTNTGDELILSDDIFTPDLDGMEDQLTIQLNVNQQQVAATIAVYNIRGNVVRTLLNNQLIGPENTLLWDGLDDQGEQLPIGHYIVFAEWFNSEGDGGSDKEKVVLSRRRF